MSEPYAELEIEKWIAGGRCPECGFTFKACVCGSIIRGLTSLLLKLQAAQPTPEEQRKTFEEWHKEKYPMVNLRRDFESGRYRDVYAEERWLGWQAAQPTSERQFCQICGHEWSRHDPEEGRCDAGPPCGCGRNLEGMQSRIAQLSRAAISRMPSPKPEPLDMSRISDATQEAKEIKTESLERAARKIGEEFNADEADIQIMAQILHETLGNGSVK